MDSSGGRIPDEAIETVQGLSTGRHGKPETRSHGFREPHQTFFGRSNAKLESGESRGQRSCRVCVRGHVEFVINNMEHGHVMSLNS